MNNTNLKFDRNRNRVKYCPCNKKNNDGKFVPYIGFENKGYCHSCAETFLPELENKVYKRELHFTPPTITTYHDNQLVSRTGRNFKDNYFVLFLKSVFKPDEVKEAILKYCIGTSKYWRGANIFWQIDERQRVRHGKIMLYDSGSGKRSKTHFQSVRSVLKIEPFNLQQCLFGLHLIKERETRTIAIVESEKTAIIMSIFKPEFLWLATGSKGGFKYDMLKPIKSYKIVAFPDKSEYFTWLNSATELQGFDITVNDWLENQTQYCKGFDLADVYLLEHAKNPQIKTIHQIEVSNKLILSNYEITAKHLGEKNSALWNLINEFGLSDLNGDEIRNLS